MCIATFVKEDSTSMVPLNGSLYGQTEDRVGMPSENSQLATGPLKQKSLFHFVMLEKITRNFACSVTPKYVIQCLRASV